MEENHQHKQHEGNEELQQRTLIQYINDRSLKAVVIGLGYVGLPMAVDMAQAGIQVDGIEIDTSKVAKLSAGHSYVIGIEDEVVQSLDAGRIVHGQAPIMQRWCRPMSLSSACQLR